MRDDLEVSHADKIFYPDEEVTKGDVVEYYRAVAEVMVPHLRGRPLTLRRYPDGIDGEGWFQKEASEHFPDWVRVESVPQRGEKGAVVHHVVCDDADTLGYLANQAVIEYHVWPSTVDSLDNPDLMVIDLDPPDQAALADLRDTARRVRDLYGSLGLTAFLQATGGRGFHVVAPLDRSAGYDSVRELARQAADHLAAERPETLTTAQRKDKRGNRIFLDTNRNAYGQTFITPYSLRAREGASAATPLDFDELGKAEPDGWPLDRLRKRLARKSDPWRDLHKHAAPAAKAQQELDRITG